MKKALKVISFISVTLVLFFIVSGLAFYHLMRTGEFRRFLVDEIERQTELKVQLGEADLEIGWITGVAFSQLRLSEPGATKPAITAERITARVALMPLFKRQVVFYEIRLQKPMAVLVRVKDGRVPLLDRLLNLPFLKRQDHQFSLDLRSIVNPDCHKKDERIVPFSCRARGLCPSPCGQRRAIEWAERMVEEVLPLFPYRQLVFTIPVSLRKSFLFDRSLYGDLCRVAYASTRDFLRAHARRGFSKFRSAVPAMVIVPQSFGDLLIAHPHAHAISSLGLFTQDGSFLRMEDIDFSGLEEIFRERFFAMMLRRGKVLPETVETMRPWEHSGFSVGWDRKLEATDIYWARSRTLENLSKLQGRLPPGVTPQIGPDATGVGWVFAYALVDKSGKHDLQQLRSFQDWYLRYWLASVPGVAEVASVGGYEKQYQVEVDPAKLRAYRLSLTGIADSIRMSDGDVGARVIELAGHEYAIRGRGYITGKGDQKIAVGADGSGTPIRLKDVAKVQIGGNIRRGLAELNGEGEVVGGIVVMRFGENALGVINRIKEKLAEVKTAFPEGVELVPTYDRSSLITASVKTLSYALSEEIVIVALTILLFLFHFRSTLIPMITLPIAVALSYIPMYYMGLTANIMSLAGIIIAIGDVVDSAVIMTENAHKKLQEDGGRRPRQEVVIEAAREIGPSILGSLLVIVVGFLPVFVLEAQEGRLFGPLAYTKTFSVMFGALLGITLVPALMVLFVKG